MEKDKKTSRKKIVGIIFSIIFAVVLMYNWQSQIVAYVVQTDDSQNINNSDIDKNNNYDAINVSYLDMIKYSLSDESNNAIVVDGITYELAPNTPIVNHGLVINNRYKLISNKEMQLMHVSLDLDDSSLYISNIEEAYIIDNIVKSRELKTLSCIIVDETTIFMATPITLNNDQSGIGLYNTDNNSFISEDGEFIIEDEDSVSIGEHELNGANFHDLAYEIINGKVVLPIKEDEKSITNNKGNTYEDNSYGGYTENVDSGSDSGETNNGSTNDTTKLVKPVINKFNVAQIGNSSTIELTWEISENDYSINSIDIYIDGVKIDSISGSTDSYRTDVTYGQHSVQIVANFNGGSVASYKKYVNVQGIINVEGISLDSDTNTILISGIEISGPSTEEIFTATIELVDESGNIITYELTSSEVEKIISSNTELEIIIDNLDSNSKYVINIYFYDESGNIIPTNQLGANYIYTDAIAPNLVSTNVKYDYYDKSSEAIATITFENPDMVDVSIEDNVGANISTMDKVKYNATFSVGEKAGLFNYQITSATYLKNQGTNELGYVTFVETNTDSYTVRNSAPDVSDSQGLEIIPGENNATMNFTYTDVDSASTSMYYTIYDENQVVVDGLENISINTFAPDSTSFNVLGLASGETYFVSISTTYEDLDPSNGVNTKTLINMQEFTVLNGTQLSFVSSGDVNNIDFNSAILNNIEFSGNAIPFIESGEVVLTTKNTSKVNIVPTSITYSMTTDNINDIKDDNVLTSFFIEGLTPNTTYEVGFNFVTLDGVEILIPATDTNIIFTTNNMTPKVVSHSITDGVTENGIYAENTPLTGTIVFDYPINTVELSNNITATSTDGLTWTYTTNASAPSITNTVKVESFTYVKNSATNATATIDSTSNLTDDITYTTHKKTPTYTLIPWDNGIEDNYQTVSFSILIDDVDIASENLDLNLYNVNDPAYAVGELVDPLNSCPINVTAGANPVMVNCTTTVPLETGATYEVRLDGTYDTYNPEEISPTPLASLELSVATFSALDILSYDVVATETTIDFTNITYTPVNNEYITDVLVEVFDQSGSVVQTLEYSETDSDNTVVDNINSGLPFSISVTNLEPNVAYTAKLSTVYTDGKSQVATGLNPMFAYTNAIEPTITDVVVTPPYVNDGTSGNFEVTFDNPSNASLDTLSYTNTGGVPGTCDISGAVDSGEQSVVSCPFTTNDIPLKDAEIEVTGFTYYENNGETTTVNGGTFNPVLYNVTKDVPTMSIADFISITSTEVANGLVEVYVEFKYLDSDLAASNVKVNAYADVNKDGIADSSTPDASIDANSQNSTPQTVTLTNLMVDTTYIIDVVADIDTFNPNVDGFNQVLASTSYTTTTGMYIEITGGELVYENESGSLLPSDTLILQNVTLNGSGVSEIENSVGASISVNETVVTLSPAMLADFSDGVQNTPISITGLDSDTLHSVVFEFPGFIIEPSSIVIDAYTNKEKIVIDSISFDAINSAYTKGATGIATLNVTDPNLIPASVVSITSQGATFSPATMEAQFIAPGTPGNAGGIGPNSITVTEVCIDLNQDPGDQISCLSTNIIGTYTVIAAEPNVSVITSNINDTSATLTVDVYDLDSIIQDATITITDPLGEAVKLLSGEIAENYPITTPSTTLSLIELVPDTVYTYTVNYNADIYDGSGMQPHVYTGTFSTTLSTIETITVSGPATVYAGSDKYQYTADVTGTNFFDPTVTWSLSGNEDVGTQIDPQTGTLTVGNGETASTISIRATSVMDPSKYSEYVVTVVPVVNTVSVAGDDTVDAGSVTSAFSATVTGYGNIDQSVTWTVSGSNSASEGTTIDSSGTLIVAPDEMAQKLTVTATSVQDSSKSGSAEIQVISAVSGIMVTGSTTQEVGTTSLYVADVFGTGNISEEVTWTIEDSQSASNGTSIDSNGLLTIASDEMASTISVVATSIQDPSKVGTLVVTIIPIYDTDIVINGPAEVIAGSTNNLYTATVSGQGNVSQEVSWTIEGEISATGTTTIDENTGELRVGADEMSPAINVIATSKVDNSVVGSMQVNIIPDIYSVTIAGPLSVYAGSTSNTYVATLLGTGSYDDSVTWDVQGETSSNTVINSEGTLTVGQDETATSLNIIASSVIEEEVMGTLTVSVLPDVNSVSVSGPVEVNAGTSNIPFTSLVEGYGTISQEVLWTVKGNSSGMTTIDANGKLTVGTDEMAPKITIVATSVQDGGQSGELDVVINSTITDVVVEGPDGVFDGDNQFTASVSGHGAYSNAVTWSIGGNNDTNTSIDSTGNVTLGAEESSPLITIKATSVQDPSVSGTKVVNVNSAITSVVVSGPTDVTPGSTSNVYTAVVTGEGTFDDSIVWSLTGSNSASNGTSIDTNGILTVAADEKASILKVTATSVQNPTMYHTLDVNVNSVVTNIEVTGRNPVPTNSTALYSATVSGYGNYSHDVEWKIDGQTSTGTKIDKSTGILTVAADETSSAIVVTATSTEDTSISGEKIVNIGPQEFNIVESDMVIPFTDGISTKQFTATINGVATSDVDWEITTMSGDPVDESIMSIDSNGLLTIHDGYQAIGLEGPFIITGAVPTDPDFSDYLIISGEYIDDYGTEWIKWREDETGNVLLVSKELVGVSQFRQDTSSVAYEGSILEKSMQSFYDGTYTGNSSAPGIGEDLKVISQPVNVNSDIEEGIEGNRDFLSNGNGILTEVDYIDGEYTTFALSASELMKVCPTVGNYADDCKFAVYDEDALGHLPTDNGGHGWYWTSSEGEWSDGYKNAAFVSPWGATFYNKPITSGYGMRPAVWVDPEYLEGIVVDGAKDINMGSTSSYTAMFDGVEIPVTWSLTGNLSNNTTIDPSTGELTVGSDELSSYVVIKATSIEDPNMYAEYYVHINPDIESIAISGPTEVGINRSADYSAIVTGVGGGITDEELTWSVTGNTSSYTYITSEGHLMVASDENAETLTITATSTTNPNISASHVVTLVDTVLSVKVTGPTQVGLGSTAQFAATVTGSGPVTQNVSWTISGNTDLTGTTIDQNGVLTVSPTETATHILVRATSVDDMSIYGEVSVQILQPTLEVTPTNPEIIFSESGSTFKFDYEVINGATSSADLEWTIEDANGAIVPLEIMSIDSTGLLTIHDGIRAIGLDGPLTVTAQDKYITTINDTVTMKGDVYIDSNNVSWVKWREDDAGNALLVTAEVMGISQFNVNNSDTEYSGSTLESQYEEFYEGVYSGNSVYSGMGSDIKDVTLPVSLNTDTEYANPSNNENIVDKGNGILTEVDQINGEYTAFPLSMSELNYKCASTGSVEDECKKANYSDGVIGATAGEPAAYWTTSDVTNIDSTGIASIDTNGQAKYSNDNLTESYGIRPAVWIDPEGNSKLDINGPTSVGIGETVDYSAMLEGIEATNLTWSIDGQTSQLTTIDPVSGMLSIGGDEDASSITVNVTNGTLTDSYEVRINPLVTGITVTGPATVNLNEYAEFSVTIEGSGANLSNEELVWTVSGASSSNTNISNNGILYVGEDELSSEVTVTATSTSNPSISGSTTIIIRVPTENYFISGPTSVGKGTHSYSVTPSNGTTSYTVVWSITGNESINTSINADTGELYIDQNESAEFIQITATSVGNDLEFATTQVAIDKNVENVLVTGPSNITYGGTAQFNYELNGTGPIDRTVTWDVVGEVHPLTTISSTGLLTVDENEEASQLTIVATSVENPIIQGNITVNINSEISSIAISGASSVNAGTTAQYTADVAGSGSFDPTVEWSIDGQNSSETTISETGLLTISTSETAPVILVTATSNADASVSSTLNVNIKTIIDSVTITGPPEVALGSETQYMATVDGVGNVTGDVTWSIQGEEGNTNIDANTGILTIDPNETASSITIMAISKDDPSCYDTHVVSITPTKSVVSMDLTNGIFDKIKSNIDIIF